MSHADNKRTKMELIENRLITNRQGSSMAELAELAQCHVSSISRYLAEFERDGVLETLADGLYRINQQKYLSNVKLSLSEALSIYLALRRFVRQTSHAPRFMLTALEKIAPALRHPVLTAELALSSQSLSATRPTGVQDSIWETLIRGWQEQVVVRLHYRKPRGSELDLHEFEPYLFEPAVLSHGTYVIGWSRTREELRTFKVDRIQHASLSEPFEQRPELSVHDLLKHAWGIWYGADLVQVELLFAPSVAARVQETRWHPKEQTQRYEDGSLYWSVTVASTLELIPWIRGWGHEVKVLAPLSLKQDIVASLRQAAALYEEEA